VNRADACAGEHRDRDFGNQRHVDTDAVAALHPEGLERIRELADIAVQLGVRQRPLVAGLPFPDDRAFVTARGLEMAVETVV
jgi:hypothetical protein